MHIDWCNLFPHGKHLFQRYHKVPSDQGTPGKSAQQRIDQPRKTGSVFVFSHQLSYGNVLSLLQENKVLEYPRYVYRRSLHDLNVSLKMYSIRLAEIFIVRQ